MPIGAFVDRNLSLLSDGLDGLSQRQQGLLARTSGIVLGLVGWVALAYVFPAGLMPYPMETVEVILELFQEGVVWPNLKATLVRTFFGFVGAMAVGTLLGILMGVNDYLRKFFTPYIIIGLSIPAIAWAIVAFLVFGFNIMTPVTATVLITFPYVGINVWKGVESINWEYVEMARSFDVSPGRIVYRSILSNIAPSMFAALRFGLSTAWKIVTIAEIVFGSTGIGVMILRSFQDYTFVEAWGWAVIFMVVVLIIEYGVFIPIENRVFEYRQQADVALV